MDKVSVIIPVYNVEKYISKTIESVCNQTYENIEIILVDDGSTDNSSKICDELAKKDNRISVIHQDNQGLSAARNVGTAIATGDFIFYLDGDDYLEQDALEILMNLSTDCDLIIGNYFYTYSDYEDVADIQYLEKSVLNTDEAMHDLLVGKIQNFAWGKLIKSDIAKKHSFPQGKLFEDTYWAHYIINECETVTITNIPVLHYRQRDNSISYTMDIKRLDILDGWSDRAEFVKEYYPEFYSEYIEFLAGSLLRIAWQIVTGMKDGKFKALKVLKDFSKEFNLIEYVNKKDIFLLKMLNKSSALYIVFAIINRVLNR